MRAARALRVALAGLALASGAAAAQDESEETRLPYEQLRGRQNEIQLGASHLVRDSSTALDVRTETVLAFVALSRGVTERLELGVLLPYVLYSEQSAVSGAGKTVREDDHYGISDPTFRVRYALKPEGTSVAVTLGLLATPDWGGRARSFNTQADSVEPFIVLGKSLGSGKAYLRYGYLHRSGDVPDAHRFTLGGRHPLGDGFGVLGHVSYLRSLGSASAAEHGTVGATLGGYTGLANGMQLLLWFGVSSFTESNAGRSDEARTRQVGLSLVHRF